MNRRKWLWAALAAVPAVVVGGFTYANAQKARTYTCPITGEELPCPKCCPLNGEQGQAATEAKAEEQKAAAEGDYICPLTGERLGCPKCCPLNKARKWAQPCGGSPVRSHGAFGVIPTPFPLVRPTLRLRP